MENLQGAFGIVTGAAQGLGYAIATAYAQAGMRLALMDVQGERLIEVANELANVGCDCLPLQVDLSNVADTRRAIERGLAHHGTPRVLVHNAAILVNRPLLDIPFEAWQREINVGIQAAFLLTQAVWSPMTAAGRGSIVYVSSMSGIKGFVGESAYCTTKHGLEGFMKCMALEGQPRNIAVNTVTPGMYMRTPMSEQNYSEELKQKWVDPIRLTPAFLFLAGQDASGVTGQRLSAWELSLQLEDKAD
ncbi:MAG: SDR family oxidoreductase [Chloroflexi bacterium]|nr:MAG: SDR family oxidoreductase [Chloroflexota bacterium]